MRNTLIIESKEIAERKEVVNQLWIDLKELADARTQALAGAKEIHTFDRDALDTKERVQVMMCATFFVFMCAVYSL